MHVETMNDTQNKENIRPRKDLSESEEGILLGADSIESLRRIVHQNVKENFVTDFNKSLIRIRQLQSQGKVCILIAQSCLTVMETFMSAFQYS